MEDLAVSVLVSAPCLLGLTMLAACIAQFGRSTASVIVGGLLFLGIDLGIRLGLWTRIHGRELGRTTQERALRNRRWPVVDIGGGVCLGCCSWTGLLAHRPHHPRLASRRSHGDTVMMDTFMVFV